MAHHPQFPPHPPSCSCPLRSPRAQELLYPNAAHPRCSTWCSGSLPGLFCPSSSPEIIPEGTEWARPGPRSRPQPGIQVPPGLHPPPLSPPSPPLNRPGPAPVGRRKAGPGGKEAGAVSAFRHRPRLRLHALYLSGARSPPPWSLPPLPSHVPPIPVRTRTWFGPSSPGDKPCARTETRNERKSTCPPK